MKFLSEMLALTLAFLFLPYISMALVELQYITSVRPVVKVLSSESEDPVFKIWELHFYVKSSDSNL